MRMRIALAALMSLMVIAGFAVAQVPTLTPQAPGSTQLRDLDQKVSYIIGLSSGNNLKRLPLKVDLDIVMRGMKDGMTEGSKPLLTPEEIQATMMQFEQIAAAAEAKEMAEMATKNKQAGAAFLAENKKRPGVTTLPSGMQYEVLKSGTGPSPQLTDDVTVHYHGTLINGRVFDSSLTQGQPITMNVQDFIPGWIEALPKMKVGDKWRLVIPSDLAYGDESHPPIEPGQTLIFEIELLATKPGTTR